MKPLTRQVFFRTIIFVLLIAAVKSHNEMAHLRIKRDVLENAEKTLEFVDFAVKSDLAMKLGTDIVRIGKFLGPAGDVAGLALLFVTGDPNEERFKKIQTKLDVIDTKLDALSDQVNPLIPVNPVFFYYIFLYY